MSDPAFSGWSLDERDPKTIQTWLAWFQWFYDHYFQAETEGWEHIPATGGALLVGSHNGGLAAPDMLITIYDWFQHFGTERPAYGLMHPHIWKAYRPIAQIASRMGAIQANPRLAIPALRRDACVLVYPGGARMSFVPIGSAIRLNFLVSKALSN